MSKVLDYSDTEIRGIQETPAGNSSSMTNSFSYTNGQGKMKATLNMNNGLQGRAIRIVKNSNDNQRYTGQQFKNNKLIDNKKNVVNVTQIGTKDAISSRLGNTKPKNTNQQSRASNPKMSKNHSSYNQIKDENTAYGIKRQSVSSLVNGYQVAVENASYMQPSIISSFENQESKQELKLNDTLSKP